MKTIRLTFTRVLILTLLLPLAARARVILYFDLLPAGATDAELYAGTANQQGGIAYGGFGDHAGIWSGTPGSFVDLNPPGLTHSRILAVSGNQQAGDATLGFGFAHAGVWSGTAASFVDLDPTGNTGSSTALALSGSQQAGAANFGTSHAGIWSGTAASFVDLHPAGASSSLAYATVGSQQAGYFRLGNEYRACIWSNTASSFVDLNPSGSTYSVAYATSGGQQAGVANYSGSPHAAIWAGTKLSFVNLRPAGADDSLAYATTGARQAGEATFSGNSHAAFWSGTAASFVDLHSVLSNTFYVSHARSIWTNNSAVFIAGYANTTSPHHNHPILWIVFPFNSQLTAGTNTPIPGGSGNFTNFPAAPSLSGSNSTFYGAGAGGQQGIYAKISGAVTKIADTTTAIPGGTGNFTTFTPPNPITPPSPIISGDNVAFRASGSGGQSGVYLKAPNDPCKLVADLNTAIPGGTGNFVSLPGDPCISGDVVAFTATGSGGQQGVYLKQPIDPCKLVADLNTAIPGGTGNFVSFPTDPCNSGDNVAFMATGSGGQQGVYFKTPVDPCKLVADLNTAIPGGSGNFVSLPIDPCISGDVVAFRASGSGGQQGVYVKQPSDPCKLVADLNTAIPGGSGSFTSFGAVSISGSDVAFLGSGSGGQQGIYARIGTALHAVVDLHDTIGGKAITALKLGRVSLAGNTLAYTATFSDGSPGVYTSDILPAPRPLLITAADRLGNDLRLNFTTVAGSNYVVQSRGDLVSGLWTNLPGTNFGNGDTNATTLTNVFTLPQQFFRIQRVP